MFITLLFDSSFPSEAVDKKPFRIDIDPNDNVDNLKVIISLKYTDLDPLSYDLFLNDRRAENNKRIIDLNLKENDVLVIKAIGGDCCLLI
jgi:hypothetical protein